MEAMLREPGRQVTLDMRQPRARFLAHEAVSVEALQDGGAERSTNVWTRFGPVGAGVGEPAAGALKLGQPHATGGERRRPTSVSA